MKWTAWMLAGACSAGLAGAAETATKETGAAAKGDEREIVVTAERMESDLQTTPFTAYRLEGLKLVERGTAVTTPEVLRGLPSVMLQKTSRGQGSPFLRGFTGFRTLMLVDGVRLNNSVFRDGPNQYWNTVDPLSLRDVEVVMGPSSVLYGSDAIGGTVNALPVQPPAAGGPAWTGRGYVRAASAENSVIGRAEAGVRADEKTGLVAGLSLKDFGDVEGGKDVGTQEHTGYDEWDVDAMLTRDIGEKARVTLGHQTVRQDDVWRTHRTVYGIDWEGLKHGTDQELSYDQGRDLTWLTLSAAEVSPWLDDLRLTIHRQQQTEDQYRVKEDGKGDEQGFDVVTWGASLQLTSESDIGRWVYGAEYLRDFVDSYSHKLNDDGSTGKAAIQGPIADDATYDTLGVYVQDAIPLMDRRLQVIPGVRYAYNRAEADRVADPVTGEAMTVDGDWDAVVGSLRASLAADRDEHVVLFAGASQGFRAPNLSDLTRLDTARSNEIETPVTDLDPEQFICLEAGLKLETGPVSAQAAYYHTWIDDLIVRTPTGRTIDELQEVTKKNSGEGYVEGVELSGEYRFVRDWALRVAAGWMEGEVDAYPTSDTVMEREPISRLMPTTVETALRWKPEAGRFWAEVAVRAAEDADRLSADDRRDTQRIPPDGTPGYTVFDVRAGMRVIEDLHVSAAVENIADEDYRIHGSGVNEPGRNFVVAVDARF